MIKRCLLAAAFVLFCAVTATAHAASSSSRPIQSSPNAIEAHLRFLADDAMLGRETASPGLRISENYVAAQFRSIDLEPGGEGGTYFQTVPLIQSLNIPSKSKLTLRFGNRQVKLNSGEDFFVKPSLLSEESTVVAPVVFVGPGIHAPEQGVDNYAGIDVQGKIVAFLGGRSETYGTLDPHIYFRPEPTAKAQGAIGAITLSMPDNDEKLKPKSRPDTSWRTENGDPHFPTFYLTGLEARATLSPSASERLFDGAATSFAEAAAKARRDEAAFKGFELPVTATISQRSIHTETSSRNVLAILRGSDPALAEEYVVITCHLDHVGVGEEIDGDAIYNGAMDNATGVAMMLEIARVMSEAPDRPKRSILFYATTAEEHGLVGSNYFVHNPTVPLENIVANINIDAPRMFFPFDEITAYGAEHATLRDLIREAANSIGYRLDEQIPIERGGSDHFSFLRNGVPGTRVIPALRSSDPDIDVEAIMAKYKAHKPDDDLSLPFDYEIGAEFADIVKAIVTEIANAETRPQWIEGDALSR